VLTSNVALATVLDADVRLVRERSWTSTEW